MSGHDTVVTDINPTGWVSTETFCYDNTDTTCIRKTSLVLRYDASASEVAFAVSLKAPDGAFTQDTVLFSPVVKLAANADIMELSIPYRDSVTLADYDIYEFSVTPLAPVKGIWTVGIDFTKY